MTPRTFWTILIKILGVYIILESLVGIPSFLNTINFLAAQPYGQVSRGELLMEYALLIINISLYGLILWYSLFKTNWIIDKLKLDKGYEDERFEFNIHRSTILRIVIMVTGGLLLIDSFPILCKDILDCIQRTADYGGYSKNPESIYLVIYLIKTFIGYFMLTCSRMIVNFMEIKRRKAVTVDDEGGFE